MRDTLYSPVNRRLCDLLRERRKQVGITQSDLARMTGRTQAYISKFENGQLRLDVADFLIFTKCLDIDSHQILDELEAAAG